MSHDDFEGGEPIRGLPAHLPPGEHILWQGAPSWRALARRVFHIPLIAIYFLILAAWRAIDLFGKEGNLGAALLASSTLVLMGLAAIAILGLIAWLMERSTVYTITNRRVVMRFGLALPKTINLPFKALESAALKTHGDGTGNIPLILKPGSAIAYLLLWPHVRPWKFSPAQPMLRALPHAEKVAEILTQAFAKAAAEDEPTQTVTTLAKDEAPQKKQPELRPILRGPLWGALALVLLSVAMITLARFTDIGTVRTKGEPETIRQIAVVDLGGDRIALTDTVKGDTIVTVEPGRDGLVRNALRGLSRARTANGIAADEPYQLILWTSGRLTLSDMANNGRHINLDSFGPAETGALGKLLAMKETDFFGQKQNTPSQDHAALTN